MNIKQATEQIRGAIRAYLSKDDCGLYRIPFYMQRPVIMFGPPGVGKTAIVSQIADELDINFVSYSITHHTRQSALGLPFIERENFGGREYSVSEYTMSEIIAAVYRAREESGVDEGILFLDEVNCVSETLAPAMLQFLQYKTFGMHRLPEGWIIVCAGNPPEYNRAAREFDPAMLDRMKRIDIEPNLQVWQEYAAAHGVHPAVLTFLESKPNDFYRVQSSVRGMQLVTARGWEDLSRMLLAYEAEDIAVDEALVRQYLQEDRTAREFASYYELFCKYQREYCVADILDGSDLTAEHAKEAPFDERVALVGIMQDAVLSRVHQAVEQEEALQYVRADLVELKPQLERASYEQAAAIVAERVEALRLESTVGTREKGQLADRALVKARRVQYLKRLVTALSHGSADGASDAFAAARAAFNEMVSQQIAAAQTTVEAVDNAFRFLDNAYHADGQETLILVTKLSSDSLFVKFVSEYPSELFLSHNKSLLFAERGLELVNAAKNIKLHENLDPPGGIPFDTE